MELIKQVKQAEQQAKEIIEKARKEAALIVEKSKQQRQQRLKDAMERRRKATDQAVKTAEQQVQGKLSELKEKGQQQRQALEQQCRPGFDQMAEELTGRL